MDRFVGGMSKRHSNASNIGIQYIVQGYFRTYAKRKRKQKTLSNVRLYPVHILKSKMKTLLMLNIWVRVQYGFGHLVWKIAEKCG